MPADRIHRLLRLISVLQRDETNTTASLMRELGVGRRTLFRDLQSLKEAGVPYRHDRAKGFTLDRDYYLPPVSLTVPETLGLMLLSKFASAQFDKPLMAPAISATHKLRSIVPEPIRQACSEMMENISVALETQMSSDGVVRYHATLQRCIDERRACRIVYKSPAEPDDLHAILHPYLLHFMNHAWYALGYVDVHDEVRMLKLTRFIELEPTDELFNRPTDFRVEDKLGSAWRMIPEGKEYRVVLDFTQKVATNVSEVLWHPSQTCQQLEDGGCRMTFEVDGINEIAWWVCGYADQVTVVKPPELRDIVQHMLRSALKRYEVDTPLEVVTKPLKPGASPRKTT
jgi:predicted DNA-binding transcriptional regulator YafY